MWDIGEKNELQDAYMCCARGGRSKRVKVGESSFLRSTPPPTARISDGFCRLGMGLVFQDLVYLDSQVQIMAE